MKQSVKISGLGVEPFADALRGIQELQSVLATQVDRAAMAPYVVLTDSGYGILEAGNRYFSSSQEAQGQPPVPLGNHIDPVGILATVKTDIKGVHIQDNVVEYYERRIASADGKKL